MTLTDRDATVLRAAYDAMRDAQTYIARTIQERGPGARGDLDGRHLFRRLDQYQGEVYLLVERHGIMFRNGWGKFPDGSEDGGAWKRKETSK